MTHHDFDIAIIGAGPAGATLALSLAHSGLRIALFDKERFPRDVICGDALSGQVLTVLKRMPDNIYQDFLRDVPKTPSWGIQFYSPGNHPLSLPYKPGFSTEDEPPGYICPRREFDDFLLQRVKGYPSIRLFEGEKVTQVTSLQDGIGIRTEKSEVTAKMIAGADGIDSVVRKSLSSRKLDKSYYCVAVRTYYEGVTGFHPQNFLELFYQERLLPGYFWIFPEVDGRANVGLGVFHSRVIKERISLKRVMEELIATDPVISGHFRNATQVAPIQARGLAMHRSLKDLSGERYLLLGDAGLLVDPFTGEGIGFAMASAESAAAVIRECAEKETFSASELAGYDFRINRRMGMEHSTSAAMQRYAVYPWLFNMIVRKANRNKVFNEFLGSGFTNDEVRKKLANPLYYARFLFG